MDEHETFSNKIEQIASDLDDLLENYQVIEYYDCETEIEEAREALSEVLYKISRM